jgi:diguanylate cyclase (GGDEF)-like protein
MLAAVVFRRLLGELRSRVRQLAVLARTDQLTGVSNRRAWDEELPRELLRAQRDRTPVCVAVLDLDRFKAFNDMRGHQEGDALLVRCGAAWREAVRTSDFIARYGGEEFAVILPGSRLADARRTAERMRRAVSEIEVAGPNGQTARVTMSFGVSEFPTYGSVEALVAAADAALYQAKRGGKDQVATATVQREEKVAAEDPSATLVVPQT